MEDKNNKFDSRYTDVTIKLIKYLGRPYLMEDPDRKKHSTSRMLKKNVPISTLSSKAGMEPGSVVYVGKERKEEAHIDVIQYSDQEQEIKLNIKVKDIVLNNDLSKISWINVKGIHEPNLIKKIGQKFDIHDLILEDITNSNLRPKIEISDKYIFCSLKLFSYSNASDKLKSKQLSIVFGDRWILSFQETGEDIFESIRMRLLQTTPRERFMSTGYLAYSLMDSVVDSYFVNLEQVVDRIEKLDNEIIEKSNPNQLQSIKKLKGELINLHKNIWPLREIIGDIENADSKYIKDYTVSYIRDLYEHVIQSLDSIDSYKEKVSSLLDIYNTSISKKMISFIKFMSVLLVVLIIIVISIVVFILI